MVYPKADDMLEHGIKVTHMCTGILKYWFPESASHGWETGVTLRHPGCAPVLMKMRFGPMPQDADAFKHVFSLKGSSGQSPCPWCSNCMGRVPYFEDDSGFAHYHSPHFNKFTLRTSETFFKMVDLRFGFL